MIKINSLPAPKLLSEHVVCFRIAHYDGTLPLSVRVSPNGNPGLIFQSTPNGSPAIKSITTSSQANESRIIPPLFLHGIISELSTMHFGPGPYTTIQTLLQPQAIQTLFGLEASTLTNSSIAADAFGSETLSLQLQAALTDEDRLELLSNYLMIRLQVAPPADMLVQSSLAFIESHIDDIQVGLLLEHAPTSVRQFNRRFLKAVGISPQLYIRIKRFNEAMNLINEGAHDRLVDIAAALHYHDQSHFIRDLKQFTGITPKSILQKVSDFSRDRAVFAYYNDTV